MVSECPHSLTPCQTLLSLGCTALHAPNEATQTLAFQVVPSYTFRPLSSKGGNRAVDFNHDLLLPALLKRPLSPTQRCLGVLPNHLAARRAAILYGLQTLRHCQECPKGDSWSKPKYASTNHQSVMKISSLAASMAFATSSKYHLAFTYLQYQTKRVN